MTESSVKSSLQRILLSFRQPGMVTASTWSTQTYLNFMRSQCREQSFDVFLQIIVAEALLHTALFEISYEWFLYQEES